MIKNIIKVSIPVIMITIIMIIGYDTYNKTLEKTKNPLSIIPTNASIILRLNNIEDISSSLRNINIWRRLLNINQIKTGNDELKKITHILLSNKTIFNKKNLFIDLLKLEFLRTMK